MQFFDITLNNCFELSRLMFALNILFQIMTQIPVLDKFEVADGKCIGLQSLYRGHVCDKVLNNC